MNFSPKLFLLVLASLIFVACQETPKTAEKPLAENSRNIKSISYGLHVDTARYTFAADRSDIYSFKGKQYSLRQKADFSPDGQLKHLIIYKEEGAQHIHDFAANKQIVDNSGLTQQPTTVLLERGSITQGAKKMTLNDQDPTANIFMVREKQPGMIRYTFYELY